MSKVFFQHSLWLRFLSKQPKPSGFTLLELLVAMIIGALISAGLLLLVIQLIQTNSREAARSDTQRDLQAAIDYIARDVREAVYAYDGNCLVEPPTGSALECRGLNNYLPDGLFKGDNLPVLAFWRVDPLTQELRERCEKNADSFSITNRSDPRRFPKAIEGVPCLSGRMYTLVVYSLNKEKTTGAKGRARIRRYELPQFTTSGSNQTPPTANTGWVDPTRKETNFLVWPLDSSTLAAGSPISLQDDKPRYNPATDNPVLTDFVDRFGLYDGSGKKAQAPILTGYELTPRRGNSASDEPNRGFYVYVKGQDRGTLNQEVVIRIQGDAAGRPGVWNEETDRPVIPISLETRVLTRGVTGKTD